MWICTWSFIEFFDSKFRSAFLVKNFFDTQFEEQQKKYYQEFHRYIINFTCAMYITTI